MISYTHVGRTTQTTIAYAHNALFIASSLFVVDVLFKLGSYGDADASRVDVSAVVPYVCVQHNCKDARAPGSCLHSWWSYVCLCT